MSKKVLSVGQCNMDHGSITRLMRELGTEVRRVDTAEEAIEALEGGPFGLVLVNRVFDADGGSGLELIRQVKAAKPGQAVMLVSNFEDAQAEARAAGAEPGFGKAALGRPETAEVLKGYL